MPPIPALATDYPELFTYFNAEAVPERSVYRYSPVFPCRIDRRWAVIKRTRGMPENAAAVAAVTRQWAARGVAVVAPLTLEVPNPARLGDTHWVAYPFIEGHPYTGRLAEVAAAGSLLGQMHATGAGPAMLPAFEWPDHDTASIAEDVAALRQLVAPHAPGWVTGRLVDLVTGFLTEVLPPIREARLPAVNASMDYKANNLVYAAGGPVLVDPDNGFFAPRLLDLAQAVLLFHTELDHLPPRLFDASQWSAFIQAYQQHVSLTDHERALWPRAIEYMLSEEGHWAFTGDPDDWQVPRQRAFLLALAEVRAEHYPLP